MNCLWITLFNNEAYPAASETVVTYKIAMRRRKNLNGGITNFFGVGGVTIFFSFSGQKCLLRGQKKFWMGVNIFFSFLKGKQNFWGVLSFFWRSNFYFEGEKKNGGGGKQNRGGGSKKSFVGGPIRGLELIMWPQGQWEALKKKTALNCTGRQTDRHTDGPGNSMTESAQWRQFSPNLKGN